MPTSCVESKARLFYPAALRIVRRLVGRDYQLGPEDLHDIAWTVALWVAIDIDEIGRSPEQDGVALHRHELEKRARAELRDFRAFRIPRVRLAADVGSVRVRVAFSECNVDSLADPRVSAAPDLLQLLSQLDAGLSAQEKSVLPHNRSSELALTAAERKRLERVKQRLREQAPRCSRLAADVAEYFDGLS